MNKSQFNIKISSELLKQIKMQAMRSGKSLTNHITELIESSLKKQDLDVSNQLSIERIEKIENRLLVIETAISNQSHLSLQLTKTKDK
tara:strand:- start:222 stop:485 length:264 start_codon:yes stop_codon:yes gene_type:complete